MDDLKRHQVTFFKSWLYTYSKNHCLMQLRKRQSQLNRELELRESNLLVMDFNESSHLQEKEEQIMRMQAALEELNEEQRLCIELFYFRQMSYQQVCDATGLSANDVKSRIQNGKRNLKIKLEKHSHE